MLKYCQLAFNFDDVKIKIKKKRIRYEIPLYRKVYSAYQFNWVKYIKIYKKLRKLAIKYDNPLIFWNARRYKILDLCYIRNKDNKLIPLGDQKHIFRVPTLHKIHNLIYNELNIITDKTIKVGCIYIYPDEEQAQIQNTWNLSIKDRVLLHIALLRLLKKGMSIETAVNKIKREFM